MTSLCVCALSAGGRDEEEEGGAHRPGDHELGESVSGLLMKQELAKQQVASVIKKKEAKSSTSSSASSTFVAPDIVLLTRTLSLSHTAPSGDYQEFSARPKAALLIYFCSLFRFVDVLKLLHIVSVLFVLKMFSFVLFLQLRTKESQT